MFKTYLTGGRVIDPANNIDKVTNLCLDIDSNRIDGFVETVHADDFDTVIDVSNCIVTPGLIDHHTHIYPFADELGLPAAATCFSSGATTAVDAGSSGCRDYQQARICLNQTRLSIYPFLNISSTGLNTNRSVEDVDPAHFDAGRIRELFEEYRGEIIGLKIRTSKNIVKELGYEPLRKTVELADQLEVPVMVHCTNPPGPMSELLGCLRKNDILTHMYMNIGSTILDETGHVSAAAKEARKRGVLFEAADARAHFGFSTAIPAIEEGFWPDIIGTDITRFSMNIRPTAFSLAMQLAKYENLGIPFEEVIRRCTINPAKSMGLKDGSGTLSAGAVADCAVFRKIEKDVIFGDRPDGDSEQKTFTGTHYYETVLTIKGGSPVYRSINF